ncbi:MAG: hypothetical protein ACU0CJ_14565, partial [Sulfitobacter sp.]
FAAFFDANDRGPVPTGEIVVLCHGASCRLALYMAPVAGQDKGSAACERSGDGLASGDAGSSPS